MTQWLAFDVETVSVGPTAWQAVELDVTTPVLNSLRIHGSLRFRDDADKELHAGGVTVRHRG
jgi:hypothetical protein